MNLKLTQKLFFGIIFLLAIATRITSLDTVPYGLHADETSFLLNSKAILLTGKDEDSRLFPVALDSIIDPKPALYSYLQIPFIFLFGSSTFVSRLPSIILGILSIAVVFLIFKEIKQEKLGIIMSFLLAMSPWHIIASRSTQEVILSFFFLCLALLFLIKFLSLKNARSLFLFAISSLVSMYSYHSAKIILPLFGVGCSFIWLYPDKKQFKKYFWKVLLTSAAVFMLSLLIINSSDRAMAIGLFSNDKIFARVIEQIYSATEDAPQLVLRLYYNKPASIITEFIHQYLLHLDPIFLFISSGEPKRYLVPYHGLFYTFEFVLLGLGFYHAVKKLPRKLNLMFFLLLVVAPIPSALTTHETPSIIRVFPMILAFLYLIAVGLLYLYENVKYKKILSFSLVIIYGLSFGQFWLQYSVQQRKIQPWHRNDAYTRISRRVREIESKYDRIMVTNDLRPLYLYFALDNLISIPELQNNPHARDQTQYSLGKFTFNRDSCNFDNIDERVLYIAEVRCKIENRRLSDLTVIDTISYLDGTPVYDLLEKAPANE